MLRAHYTIYKFIVAFLVVVVVLLAQRKTFPVPSIMHKYCRYFQAPPCLHTPATSPAALLIGLVAVLTFCVFNNIYLKAQTIGQKCANCSEIAQQQKEKIEERRKEKI